MTPPPRISNRIASRRTAPGRTARRTLAVFDLDKTIVDTSASMAYGRPMAKRGIITTGEMLRIGAMLFSYMMTTHTDENLDATKEALASMIRNRPAASLRAIAEDALQEVLIPYVYAEARDFIFEHHKLGHDVAIITASARVLVDPIARELQADHLIATELEEIDGTYTGKVLHFNKGQAKGGKLMELVERGGYDLSRPYAYTDSHTDLPLLEAVGHPYAINPDRQLRKIARERDWPIEYFSRPEPLFKPGKVIAGAGTLALIGAATTGLILWLRQRAQDVGSASTPQLLARLMPRRTY